MRPLVFLVPLILAAHAGPVFAAPAEQPADFHYDVKPILSDRCFVCHGPDRENREADLRLDTRQGAMRPSESGNGSHVIKPGDPRQSELYLRIASEDDDLVMPPSDSNLALTKGEIEQIRRWIEQGAPWKDHWAFVPPRQVPLAKVQDKSWSKNEIDGFILRRLKREGLKPSPEAPREKLIRRLSFDLTGLPPTREEIDVFLADSSPQAYQHVVDRLLGSPHYGQRMAAVWLDVARYSDTYGYQVDRDRFVWPWRDWVIRAMNANMPYDQFITQQLAGDLLPDATDDQILATAFNRLHPQKVEGGSVPEEFRIEYVADRVQTLATALLGLTMECARCHDHKYDPITQKEYYQLCAFFDNIDEAGLYSYFTPAVPTPTLRLADERAKAKMADLEKRIESAELNLARTAQTRQKAFQQWLRGARGSRVPDEEPPGPTASSDQTLTETATEPVKQVDLGPHARDNPRMPGQIAYLDFEDQPPGSNQSVSGRIGKAIRLTGDDGICLDVGNFCRFDPFSVALWLHAPDQKQRAVVFHRSRAWTDAGSRGYQLLIEDGRLSASLIHFWPGNAICVRTREKIPTGQWQHVVVTYDGSSRAAGLRIHLDGREAECEVIRDNLYKNITGGGGDNITIGQRFRDRGFTGGLVDEFYVFQRELTAIQIAQLYDGKSLSEALRVSTDKLTDEQRDQLFWYYLTTVDPEYHQEREALKAVRQQRSQQNDGIPEIMVMRELKAPRPTYLLARGAYDARTEQVLPDTPAALLAFPHDQPRNRLGLARWLTRADHPLTARVAVNRYWQMLFGHGLVRTPEDFGSQGQLPTHPDLLDWLARDFVTHGWDVKRLLKQMVMSATYRQSSDFTAEGLARDPENRLRARATSHRLPAEMLRDNALAVSGLLVERIGGPPAKPYEVEVSFKPAKRDQGEGLYRRSLYTYWKRTGPAPMMMTLDASKRDVCRVRRERTSSPLQALVLMNGPQLVEASCQLAQRLIQEHQENTDIILADLFRILTSRRPTEAEKHVLRDLYQQQLSYFHEQAGRAEQYLNTGDSPHDSKIDRARLAATAVVANTLLSFDECVMKR